MHVMLTLGLQQASFSFLHGIRLHTDLSAMQTFQQSYLDKLHVLQSFPQLYECVLKASDVMNTLRGQGPVDIKDLSSRLTAGESHLCCAVLCCAVLCCAVRPAPSSLMHSVPNLTSHTCVHSITSERTFYNALSHAHL